MLFEKKLFSGWSESINSVAMAHLKRHLFRKDPETGNSPVMIRMLPLSAGLMLPETREARKQRT